MNEKYGLEQVSVRMIREAPLLSDEKIQNPQDAIRILGDVFKDYDREVVGVVHLRSDNVPINMTIVSIGCLNQSLVHPREMLKAAFLSNASSIMMFHNHPSGSLVPSREDIAITNLCSSSACWQEFRWWIISSLVRTIFIIPFEKRIFFPWMTFGILQIFQM